MRNLLGYIVFFLIAGCQTTRQVMPYEKNIGDISFDPRTDKKSFHLCYPNTVQQYFAFTSDKGFIDYKPRVDSLFFTTYRSVPVNESGLIRIRFIVNCKGETDRFRMLSMNIQYEPVRFDKRITDQLLSITKNTRCWQIQMVNEKPIDYYQYLIFKINKGQLIEILP